MQFVGIVAHMASFKGLKARRRDHIYLVQSLVVTASHHRDVSHQNCSHCNLRHLRHSRPPSRNEVPVFLTFPALRPASSENATAIQDTRCSPTPGGLVLQI